MLTLEQYGFELSVHLHVDFFSSKYELYYCMTCGWLTKQMLNRGEEGTAGQLLLLTPPSFKGQYISSNFKKK